MAIRKIVTVPDPVLDKKTEEVKEINDEIKEIIRDLKDTLENAEEPEGAGLSANQMGVSKSICAVRNYLPETDAFGENIFEEFILINPEITKKSKETDIEYEGCLSIPDVYGKVERPARIKVTALTLSGDIIKLKAEGFFARVIQHEIDHLNGILFTSKVTGKTLTEEEFDKQFE